MMAQTEQPVDWAYRGFEECSSEKNWSLTGMTLSCRSGKFFDATGDQSVKAVALELIDSETDVKYCKKYTSVWRK